MFDFQKYHLLWIIDLKSLKRWFSLKTIINSVVANNFCLLPLQHYVIKYSKRSKENAVLKKRNPNLNMNRIAFPYSISSFFLDNFYQINWIIRLKLHRNGNIKLCKSGLHLVYDWNHYFGLGPIPKPKPELAYTYGWYHNWYQNWNHISKGESS